MSYILSRKYARKSDPDFVIAAARAFYVDWWCSRMEELGRLPGQCELTDVAPETQRWAFKLARNFAARVVETKKPDRDTLESILDDWFDKWAGDREATEDNAGWYAAMQAMGHGVGLYDAGRLDVDLPRVEAYPC